MDLSTLTNSQFGDGSSVDGSNIIQEALSSVLAGVVTAGSVGAILADPATEDAQVAGDRVDEEVLANTVISTQEATVPVVMEQAKPNIILETSNQDCSGNMKSMTDRWIKIGETDWTTTDPIYKIKGRYQYPNDVLKQDTVYKSFTHFFAYFRCDIEFMATCTGTKFHQGAVAICYAARDGVNSHYWEEASARFRNIRMVPHTILNMQNATSGKFLIPYNNLTALFDREQSLSRGLVCVIPWSSLLAPAGGNTTLPVTLFSSLKNLKVYGMTKEKTPFSTTQFQIARRMFQKGFSKMETDGKDHVFLKLVMKTLTDTFPDAFAEGIASTINVGAHVFNTANVSQGENFVQDLSFLGETCVTDSSVVSSKPLCYKDLLTIPIPLATVNWKKTDKSGHILWSSPIGPLMMTGNRKVTSSAATTNWGAYEQISIAETMVDHVSKFARFWRGSLKFSFEFFNAGLMKGRVKIGILFGERTYTSENSCYFITHDLGVQDKCEIVIPYNSWRDWMSVPNVPTQFIMGGSALKKFIPQIAKASTLGVIGIEVINTLTVTSSMVNNLNIKVSVSSDNYQLAWPVFNSRSYDYVKGDYGWAWEGKGRGLVVDSTKGASFYPKTKAYGSVVHLEQYGDMPDVKSLEERAESFIGSFAAQSSVAAAQPELPTTCPFKASYIGNHVEIASLMTRPALVAHANVWVVQDDPLTTGTETFEVPNRTGTLLIDPGATGIAEIGIKYKHKNEWPWLNTIRPHEQQQEVCRLGTYWSGSARLHVAVSDYEHAAITLKAGVAGNPGVMSKKASPSSSGALLFITFSDEPVLTTKDMLNNGAFCMNLGQQKMATFNIPYYMIEQQKRLSGTDLSWRMFIVTRNEVAFDVNVWLSFGKDFNLYFPTLMPDRKYFGGATTSGITGKSQYYYPEGPSNWNYFQPGVSTVDEEPPVINKTEEKPEGLIASMLKAKCKCTCSAGINDELDAAADEPIEFTTPCMICKQTKVKFHGVVCDQCVVKLFSDMEKSLMESGDVESNPGPCTKCGVEVLPGGACECQILTGEFDHLISRNRGQIFNDIPHNLQKMMLVKLRSGQGVNLNDVVTHFKNYNLDYKVVRKLVKGTDNIIEIVARLSLYNRGKLVYYSSVLYCGISETGIHKELRRKLLDKWLTVQRKAFPGFFQMCDLCNELDFRCEGLVDSITSTVEGLVTKITTVAENLFTSAQLLANAKNYLDDAKMRLYIFVAKLMLHIANVAINHSKENVAFICAGLGLDIASLPGVSKLVLAKISELASGFYNAVANCLNTEERAEGLMDNIPQMASMFSLIVVTCLGVSSSACDLAACVKSVTDTFKSVGAVTSGMKGIAWMVDSFWKCFSGVLNYYQGGFTLEERACIFFKENKERIFLWDKEVAEVETTYTKGKTIMDECLRSKVHELFKIGSEIHTGCLMAKETAHLFAKLRSNYAKVSKWKQELLKMDGVFKARPEPVVVYLYGEPGQGKSLVSTLMAREMCTFIKTKPDNFYSIPPNFKHLDNYAQQPVVIIDDLGQGSDDEDWKIFCQMVSTTPFVAPQADLADKGMAFTSPVIIATSNIDNPRPLTVNNPDAVQRRLRFKVYVRAHPDYRDANGNLDFTKALAEDKVANSDCLSLTVMEDDWINGRKFTYHQLMYCVKKELVRRKVNMEGMANIIPDHMDDYDEMLDKARAEAMDPPGTFVECDQCQGNKICLKCENQMKCQDGFPQLSMRDIVREVMKTDMMVEAEENARLNLGNIEKVKTNLRGFYGHCYADDDLATYYFTIDCLRKRIMAKELRDFTDRYNERTLPFLQYAEAICAVAAMSIVIGMLVMIYKGVNWWLGSEAEGYSQGDARKMKPKPMPRTKVGAKPKVEGVCTAVQDAVMRNQEFVSFYAGERKCCSGMITFLDSTTILTCKHVLLEPADDKLTHFRIAKDDVYVDVPVSGDRMLQLEYDGKEVDAVIITLANPFMGKKKITHLFATEAQAQWSESSPMMLMTKKMNIVRQIIAQRPYYYRDAGSYKDDQGIEYPYPAIIRYNMPDRGPGDSGGLVSSLHTAVGGRIIGMHVAGTNAYGMALPITREMAEEFLVIAIRGPGDCSHIEAPIEVDKEGEKCHVYPFIGEKVTSLGDAPSRVTIARTTDLKPSPIAGVVLPILREPAALHPGDKRVKENQGDPIWNMPKKFAKNTGFVNQQYLGQAVEHYSNIINCNSTNEDGRVLNLDESINGLPGESLECIPMSTSPGYPYSQQKRELKGKRAFFTETEVDGKPFYEAKDALKERIAEREANAKKRTRTDGSYFQTALKNELRTIKKVTTNMARTIEGCPLDYLLLFRQYVGSFANWITKNYGTLTGSCVGCNPDVDWTLFHQEITSIGDKFITVDFTNWDGSIPTQYLYAACSVINRFYLAAFKRKWHGKEESPGYHEACEEFNLEQNVRDVLFDELAVTISVVQDQLVLTVNGLPSGHPLTAILNCIIHALKMLVAFQEATAQKPEWTLARYEKNKKSLFYGDDGATGISDALAKVFTRFDLARTSAREGMLCTMEDKDSEMTAFSSIDQISYLKRKFERCEEDTHIILAPIELRTIGSLLNWVRDNGTFEQNVEDAMWFLYHHGSKIYNEYKQKILLAMSQVGLEMTLPTWKQQYQNHMIKFTKLDSEWRTRPIVPKVTTLIARGIAANRLQMKYLEANDLPIEKWTPYLSEKTQFQHLCPCGAIVFTLTEGRCYRCLGVEDIPSWYFYKDQTMEGCLALEKHHLGTDGKIWHFAYLNQKKAPGFKSLKHHVCKVCDRTVLHCSLTQKGRTCLICLGIDVPEWYCLGANNKDLLLLSGDVESNPGPFYLAFILGIVLGFTYAAGSHYIESLLITLLQSIFLRKATREERRKVAENLRMMNSFLSIGFYTAWIDFIFFWGRYYLQIFYMMWILFLRHRSVN